jgi:selenophosphate synthetase-related protein
MDMTGWMQGQVFVQTVDEKEVEKVTAFLTSRGLTFQVLTLSERMVLDNGDPTASVTTDRFSIAVQLAGFPQVVGPVLSDLVQRVHGGGWDAEPPADA